MDASSTTNIILIVVALFIIISIVAIVFWVLMLIHAITKNTTETQIVWIAVMIAFGPLAALIYYFAVKKPLDAQAFTGSTVKGTTSFK